MKLRIRPLPLATLLALGIPAIAHAGAIRIWDGDGPDAFWSSVGPNLVTNWTDKSSGTPIPAPGDSLRFAGTRGLSALNDRADLEIAGIRFDNHAGAFVLGGQSIVSTGDIVNGSTVLQKLAMPIALGADQLWDGQDGGLEFSGGVRFDGHSLRLRRASAFIRVLFGQKVDLSVESGGVVTSDAFDFSGLPDGKGVTVTGTGSRLTATDRLAVGEGSLGTLRILDGGVVDSAHSFLGSSEDPTRIVNSGHGNGTVIVSGAGSRWKAGEDPGIGRFGTGLLQVLAGGRVESFGTAGIGMLSVRESHQVSIEDSGAVSIDGPGSWWGHGGLLVIGNQGHGRVDVTRGGRIEAAGVLMAAAITRYRVNDNVSVDRISTGTLTVSGTGSALDVSGTMIVGVDGSASVDVSAGGTLRSGAVFAATGTPGVAAIGIREAGSSWTATGNFVVGSVGQATLAVTDGGLLSVSGTLTVGSRGELRLDRGRVEAGQLAFADGARFTWTAGLLDLGGGTLDGHFGPLVVLDAGRSVRFRGDGAIGPDLVVLLQQGTLESGGTFTQRGVLHAIGGTTVSAPTFVNEGTTLVGGLLSGGTVRNAGALQLTGGGRIDTDALVMEGGTLTARSLDLDHDVRSLRGHGTVTAEIAGGAGRTILAAADGAPAGARRTLALGNVASARGFAFAGVLDVDTQDVVLLDADVAELGLSTRLAEGGRLSAPHGLHLARGHLIVAEGSAVVDGELHNEGTVSGPETGVLRFLDDVRGPGGFGGRVAFEGAYRPGNSPAAVDFNGGDAIFDATSLLVLEVLGPTPGVQFDRLTGIRHLTFDGRLSLAFSGGYVPAAGQRFDVLDFETLTGGFDPARIEVTGVAKDRLDFSGLAIDGSFAVRPVPEPGTWAMLLAGLALGGIVVRGRRAAA